MIGTAAQTSNSSPPTHSLVRNTLLRDHGRCSRNRYVPWPDSRVDWRKPKPMAAAKEIMKKYVENVPSTNGMLSGVTRSRPYERAGMELKSDFGRGINS